MRIRAISATLLASAFFLQPANAAIITVTVEGTLSSGRDDFNYFGAGTNLAGQSARIVFTFDDETPSTNLVNSGDNQYVFGYGPDYGAGWCCSPGSATAFINGVQLDNNGGYWSRYSISYSTQPVASDSVGAQTDAKHYIYDGTSIIYSVNNYSNVGITGLDILNTADLRQSIDFLGGSNGANVSAGIVYNIWDYAQPGYVQYIEAYFQSTGTTVSIVGPNVEPPPVGGVPEPAAWAMLIAGFGLVGAAARRRRPLLSA